MKTRDIISNIILSLIILGVLFIGFIFVGMKIQQSDYYQNIYIPAKLSVQSACNIITQEELKEKGFIEAGYFDVSKQQIIIIIDTPEVNKHEQCHAIQYSENRSYLCDKKFKMFFNEIECVKAGRLSDEEFNLKYGK